MGRTHWPLILAIWVLQTGLTILMLNQPLCWDNILLAGKIPEVFWAGRFSTLFVPEELAGYPPLFGMYIAQGWLWFGRSLAVTHLLMLPFLFGIGYQTVRLAQAFVPHRALRLTVVALLCGPVLLSLQAQTGPDLPMIWLFITALNAIVYRSRALLAIALVPLALVSPRGALCLAPLFSIDQILLGNKVFAFRWLWAVGKAMAFLPAAILVAAWALAQHSHYGWWITKPGGDFEALSVLVDGPGYARNVGIALWRMVDFGQIAIYIGLITIVIAILRRRVEGLEQRPAIAIITSVTTISFIAFFALFANPIGHRYMALPVLLATLWICAEWAQVRRYSAFSSKMWLLLLFLGTGHFWVALYPKQIAKGWDATLCHLQAGWARQSLKAWADEHPELKTGAIGAHWPDAGSWRYAFITDDPPGTGYSELDRRYSPYVLANNATNDFTNAELVWADSLERLSPPRLLIERWPVRMAVLRNPATGKPKAK